MLCSAFSVLFFFISTETWHRPLCVFSAPRLSLSCNYVHKHERLRTQLHRPSRRVCDSGGWWWGRRWRAAECHPTNEFLLTSPSPLKKQFVLKRRCAELPCSCLCSHARRHHLLSALFCYLRRLSFSPSPPTASLICFPCTLISFHADLELKLTARRVLMSSRWLRSRARSLLLL